MGAARKARGMESASDNLGLENRELKEQIKDLEIELRSVKRQKMGLQKERVD